MKKTPTKKLSLDTQTVRTLSGDQLGGAAGGSLSATVGGINLTSQLNNAGWTTIIIRPGG